MWIVLIFLNTIIEKRTLNPEITLLYQFHAQKTLFKVPKICNINFWIENDPPKNSSDLVAGPFPEEKEREEDDKKNYKICYSRNLYIFTIDRKNWLRCEKKKGKQNNK